MKKLLFSFMLLCTTVAFAQVPQGISYQAIALNGSGNAVANANVGLRLSILDNAATGTVLYTETHIKMTNGQGLFNTIIGQGSPTSGNFTSINWGTGDKFLKVEIDVAGGTNYAIVGTTQLLSVPYALMAGGLAANSNVNDVIGDNKYANFCFYNSGNFTTYAFNQNTGTWTGQAGGGGTVYESNGNFCFYNSGNFTTYAFNKDTGIWVGQAGGGGTILSSNGNFCFYNSGNFRTYVFNQNTGTWVGQAGGGGTVYESNGNFCFYNPGNFTTYAFNKKTGNWVGQAGGGGAVYESNGNFCFYNSGNFRTYVFNQNTGTWSGQSGGGGTVVISPSN